MPSLSIPIMNYLCYIPLLNSIVVFPLRDALFDRSDKLLFSCSKIVQHSVFTVLSISKGNKNLMGFEQEHSHSVCEQRLNWSVVGKQSVVRNLFTEVPANKVRFYSHLLGSDFGPICSLLSFPTPPLPPAPPISDPCSLFPHCLLLVWGSILISSEVFILRVELQDEIMRYVL